MDKELLLKDLSPRLPHRIVVHYNGLARPLFGIEPTQHFQIILDNALDGEHNGLVYVSLDVDGEEPKPYLRPMESMTEEEVKELKTLCSIHIPTDSPTIAFEEYGILVFTHHLTNNTYSFRLNLDVIDWLNKHHFDYRGLIPMGLALEAPKGMYN